jgi:hypothetical protein
VVRETAEEIELRNGIVIRVQTPNCRRIRGFTAVAVILDEKTPVPQTKLPLAALVSIAGLTFHQLIRLARRLEEAGL